MIQKAIIVERSTKEPNKYKVRIPVIHGLASTPSSTKDEDLPYAAVCGISGFDGVINNGDVVYVSFENNEFDTPVILGQLLIDSGVANLLEDADRDIQTSSTIQSLVVKSSGKSGEAYAKLPNNTTIGEVTPFEISTLSGVKKNIQSQIDSVSGDIDDIKHNYYSISVVQEIPSLNTYTGVSYSDGRLVVSKASRNWDTGAYSSEYYSSCVVSYKVESVSFLMCGLISTDRTITDFPAYNQLNYAWYTENRGGQSPRVLSIYESGTGVSGVSRTYNIGDTLSIVYDENSVIYIHNGEVVRVVNNVTAQFRLGVSAYENAEISSIRFGQSYSYNNNYSTDETMIGMWIDGKPLYRKVFQYSNAIAANTLVSIGSIGSAIGTVAKIDKTIRNSSNEWWSDNYYSSERPEGIAIRISKGTGDVSVLSTNENWGSPILNVIIEYTKA